MRLCGLSLLSVYNGKRRSALRVDRLNPQRLDLNRDVSLS